MDRRIDALLQILAKNISSIKSVDKLAESLNLSASRVRHLFRREMGISLGRYIMSARLVKAATLLEGSFHSVKEVTFEIGLSDETHFIREFKKKYGVTPGQFRSFSNERLAGNPSQVPSATPTDE